MKTLCESKRVAGSRALRRCCGWSKDAIPAAIEKMDGALSQTRKTARIDILRHLVSRFSPCNLTVNEVGHLVQPEVGSIEHLVKRLVFHL
jgi:hypothetical protein